MVLTQKEKETVMRTFPSFELCYEEHIRSKVHSTSATLYLAIAKGAKCFAWFTLYQGRPTCFVIERDKGHNRIRNIETWHSCFDETLCIGTVLHGVLMKKDGLQFCVVDDVYFYKGTFLGNRSTKAKLKYMEHFFTETRMVSYSPRFIVFVLSLMNTSKNALVENFENLGYVPYCIQYRNLNASCSYLNERYVFDKSIVLLVRPDPQNDIYKFFCTHSGTAQEDGRLNIPDYKTSVMMNSLFRNIKENVNLDTLEESDSEEEFENINDDKYITKKELNMVCSFNSSIRRWEPVKVSSSSKLTNREMLRHLEKI